jgi:hypothetical protein
MDRWAESKRRKEYDVLLCYISMLEPEGNNNRPFISKVNIEPRRHVPPHTGKHYKIVDLIRSI